MELRRLRYFIRIAAEGSLGAASRALGIAQPALSRQMQLLESELGVQLFLRIAKGMRLTEEGEYLRDAIGHLLQQLDIALHNVQNFSTRAEATCTLGLPPVIAQLLGPRLVLRLAAEMPNLKLRLVEDDSVKLAAELLRGTVDVAILAGFTPDDRLFHAEMLSEQLLLVGAPASGLAGRAPVRFADLEQYGLILPSRPASLPVTLEKLAARFATRIRVTHEIDSVDVTKDLVKSNLGYAILPALAIKGELAAGELAAVPITDPDLTQSAHFAAQLHWRIPRSTFNQFHFLFYDEWISAVDGGDWPATWLYDRDLIAKNTA